MGRDVVSSGPDNVTPASAQQTVTVPATVTGGTFTLTFAGSTTNAISFEATAETVQAELRALASIGGTNVNVTGGPGAVAPFVVTFASSLANNPEPLIEIDSSNLVGDVASAENTTKGANGFEVCAAVVNLCQAGSSQGTGGAFAAPSGDSSASRRSARRTPGI